MLLVVEIRSAAGTFVRISQQAHSWCALNLHADIAEARKLHTDVQNVQYWTSAVAPTMQIFAIINYSCERCTQLAAEHNKNAP